jgi:hypothetical protein
MANVHVDPPHAVRGRVESASEALDQFIKRKGGIIVRAVRFSQGRERLQPRISVRRHQSEIVLGVLVIILCSDDIPRPRFFLG